MINSDNEKFSEICHDAYIEYFVKYKNALPPTKEQVKKIMDTHFRNEDVNFVEHDSNISCHINYALFLKDEKCLSPKYFRSDYNEKN